MNNENNINGIPNADSLKIEETPAQSFDNLYGNSGQTVQPQPMSNPQVVQPAPTVQQPVQPQPMSNPQVVQPAPTVQQPVQPQPMPNPQVVQPTPTVQQPVQPQPMPNPQVVQPTPTVQQPVQPQPMPNPQVVEPIQSVQVDADRLQSIEEQLSKTSQYKPEDFQQEIIDIPTTNQYEKNKSGLTFVIVLSIILALAIAALPFITKFFS